MTEIGQKADIISGCESFITEGTRGLSEESLEFLMQQQADMNIGKFPKEFHGIVEEKKGMGDEKATPLDSGFWMVDGERKRKG